MKCSTGYCDWLGHNPITLISPDIERQSTLEPTRTLDDFFTAVERRALRMAEIATGNHEDAFDILQDSMVKMVQKYASENPDEWTPLFYRILQNRIRDWYRREAIRNRFRVWFGNNTENETDPLQDIPDTGSPGPEQALLKQNSMNMLEIAIRKLPLRQQQVFMLRTFEEFDVKETAQMMNCSEGSVKTHYSRAVHALRRQLGDDWP